MEISNYVDLSNENVFTGTYCDGVDNIRKCFAQEATKLIFDPAKQEFSPQQLNLADRVTHLVVGLGLILLPLVNLVIYCALKHFTREFAPDRPESKTNAKNPPLPPVATNPQTATPSNQQVNATPSNQQVNATLSNQQVNATPSNPQAISAPPSTYTHIGAGVLPYCIDKGEVYFLLSKEGYGESEDTWCDFGGACDEGESPLETAARECWEESRGIIGDKKAITSKISNDSCIGKKYPMYFMEVQRTPDINNQKFLQRTFTEFCHMEKTQIAWVKANDVFKAVMNNTPVNIENRPEQLRDFFAKTILVALDNPKGKAVLDRLLQTAQKTATAASSTLKPSSTHVNQFTTEQIHNWLFNGAQDQNFPTSTLAKKQKGRLKEKYAPKTSFSNIPMLSDKGKYTSRIGIYNGGITDIRAEIGQRAAVGDSNNGDLLTGCGYAVATAVINATGPNLQRDLYNKYGVPQIMEVPKYGSQHYSSTEGRGYALSCDAYDMRKTHNIEQVEFMTVPMDSLEGVRNMYKEAYEHSKDLDFIAMPMAGMSHPVLKDNPKLSAEIATSEFKKFVDHHPDSRLKVVFTIFKDPNAEKLYSQAAAS